MIANTEILPIILWLKRDLRLSDNPAMYLAQTLGPTIAIVSIEPSIWSGNDYSKRHLSFYLQAVHELSKALSDLNVPLYIIESEFPNALDKLLLQLKNFILVSHQETGNWLSFKRDERVKNWCKIHNIVWHQPRQNNVIRNLKDRDFWTKYWSSFMNASCKPIPKFQMNKSIKSFSLKNPFKKIRFESAEETLSTLLVKPKLYSLPKITFPNTINDSLNEILKSFFSSRALNYKREIGSPITSVNSCSRLSPYLSWGLISIREVYQELKKAKNYWKKQSTPYSKSMILNLTSFEKRLHWRCHFIQKLESEPEIEYKCFHPYMENIRDSKYKFEDTQYKFNAWKNSETGIDFIDACMNCLNETGWLNFRMRAMLMSFASYNLWLDWRKTGEHLAKLFLDYEPGIHWPQVQMQSGTSGINTIRIYNPLKQQKEHDPKLVFTNKWVESSILSKKIVSVQESSSKAREEIWKIKKTKAYGDLSKKIFLKHGSRLKKKNNPNNFKNNHTNKDKKSSNLSKRYNLDLFD